MAETDDRLARSYRSLAREEPPPALDAAILAAARESVRPRARNRWAGPVSIAAVLVLGIGISLRMQLEQPGIETSVPAAPEMRAKESPPEARVPDVKVEAPAKNAASVDRQQAPRPKLSRTAPAADPVPQPAAPAKEKDAPPPEPLEKKRLDAAPVAQAFRAEPKPLAEAAPPAPAAASPPPMRAKGEAAGAVARDTAKQDADERVTELERIARLRRDGRDAEADKALEEFRRRHPDYRIPEAMWERVRPR